MILDKKSKACTLKCLIVSTLCTIGIQSTLSGKLILIENSTNTLAESATIELRNAATLKNIIARYRLKEPFPCPRYGFTLEEKMQGVAQAKDCITRLKERHSQIAALQKDTTANYILQSNLYKAINQCSQVIGAYGSPQDAEWINKQVTGVHSPFACAQIYLRHNVPFEKIAENPDIESLLDIAFDMARAKNKPALDWIEQRLEAGKNVGLLHIALPLIVKNQHPTASKYSEQVIDDYLAALAKRKDPNKNVRFWGSLPWALIQIHIDQNQEYLAKVANLKIPEAASRNELYHLIAKDPLPLLDMLLGIKGKLSKADEAGFGKADLNGNLLRSATELRSAEEVNKIVQHYSNGIAMISNRMKLFGGFDRINSYTADQIIRLEMSATRPSASAASLVESYSDSQNTEYRFRYTPWIKMLWIPDYMLEMIASTNAYYLSIDRLSAFSHDEVKKSARKLNQPPKEILEALMLHHKFINQAFKTPQSVTLGALHSAAVRIKDPNQKLGVHSLIQVITPKTQGKLTIAFKLRSIHKDAGGLGSAISKNHLKLESLDKDNCRAQIGNVRCVTNQGITVPLEFSRTTQGGIHVFECPMPKGGVSGLNLYFDWSPMGETHTLSHPLYEPWFALK